MIITLKDIRFKAILAILVVAICLMLAASLFVIIPKLPVRAFVNSRDGLGGTTLYLENDGKGKLIGWCDICNDQVTKISWFSEGNIININYVDSTSRIEKYYDYVDSLVDISTNTTIFYSFNLQGSQNFLNSQDLPPPPKPEPKYAVKYKGKTYEFWNDGDYKKFIDTLKIKKTVKIQ